MHAGEAVYQVQLTRLLNTHIRPDDAYLRGQLPVQGKEQYLGVFLKIKNEGKSDYLPPRDMKVVDTVGNEYLPLDAVQSGFGLDFGEPIPPGDDVPPPDSPASSDRWTGRWCCSGSSRTRRPRTCRSCWRSPPAETELPGSSSTSSCG